MNMEILTDNFVNTTTMITASQGGTSGAGFLFDRKREKQFGSGDASDATLTTIQIDFDSTLTSIDRIGLENMNFKKFKVYFNSASANLFSLTSANTGTSSWTQNSETSLYMILQSATSFISMFIEVSSTMVAAQEKKIGQVWVAQKQFQFSNNPTAKEYKVDIARKEFVHNMSDGGTAIYVISNNWKADIKKTFVNESDHDDLKDIHDDWNPLVFTPFPTGTNWDSRIYACNWVGAWDFDNYSSNIKGNGFQGTIRLREVAK